MRIDLHLHTSASDGELSPYDLILLCKRIGFDIIAIADHDTMKGFEEIKDIKIGIEIIPAVELSVREENKDIHLLGYYVNNEGSPLFDYLKVFREERIRRIYKIVENLKKMGIKIEAEEIFKESNNAHAIGRPHVARVLVKKGYAENIDDAFEKYIGYSSPAYVPKYKIGVKEGIDIIIKSKGIPILAHPGQYYDLEYFLFLKNYGLKGIEVWHPDNEKYLEELLEFVEKNKFLKTGGSDFHGFNHDSKKEIGKILIPYESVLALKKERTN
ncbi:MAG: PHP domain-containing protein [candidate division WOR-3 bacterium]